MDQRIACRTAKKGVAVWSGSPRASVDTNFPTEELKNCRALEFSSSGKYLAWSSSTGVKVVSTTGWKTVLELPSGRVSALQFSPSENYFCTWEPYQVTKDLPQGFENLKIVKLADGSIAKSYVQKKTTGWEPSWSSDDQLCGRNLNGDVHFFEKENFACITHKMVGMKISHLSIAPGPAPYHVLCYIAGTKGQPSFARIFQFPKLENNFAVANKSFFQGDQVEVKWNKSGKEVLLMASTEVDKSGASYYGKHALYFLDTKGSSAMIQPDKQGPIYAFEFSPKGNEFCVIYGFMPSVCKVFDMKCNQIRDYGTGPRNSIYYNPHGNLLLIGGFGNIPGKVEIWDVKTHKEILKVEIPDTTHLSWSADGEHFLTATTAPRLRVNNGFKIWHYTGSLQFEYKIEEGDELNQVVVQPVPAGVFPEKAVVTKKVPGIESAVPQASKQAYVPPSARNRPPGSGSHPPMQTKIVNGVIERVNRLPPGLAPPPASTAPPTAGKKKKRGSRKPKTGGGEGGESSGEEEVAPPPQPKVPFSPPVEKLPPVLSPADKEREKQISGLKKKLDQITKMKGEVAAGKKLELNQLEKITKEEEYRKDLEKLMIR